MAKRAADVEAGPSAPAPKKNHYVFRHGGGWAVKAARARRITSVHPTREEAIDAARELAWPDAEVIYDSYSGKFKHLLPKDMDPEDFRRFMRSVYEQYMRGTYPA